jgi:uracil-DNA glycosylase
MLISLKSNVTNGKIEISGMETGANARRFLKLAGRIARLKKQHLVISVDTSWAFFGLGCPGTDDIVNRLCVFLASLLAEVDVEVTVVVGARAVECLLR